MNRFLLGIGRRLPSPAGPGAGRHGALLALLGLAWALRSVLAWRGGQFYFPDEVRYLRSRELLLPSTYGSPGSPPWDLLLSRPEHMGYVVIGMAGELARFVAGRLAGRADYTAVGPDSPFWAAAALLSFASVAAIGLTYGLARRAGADGHESFLTAALLACSTAMFYYARHLVPYDSALALALLAAWVGLRRDPGPLRSLLVGFCAGLAFLTYNGYWVSAAVAIGLHLTAWPRSARDLLKRAALAGLGLAALPVLLALATRARHLTPFDAALRRFSGTVTQGDFAEGWSFPWEYLWHAEHGLLLVWLVGVVGVAWLAGHGCLAARSRGLRWLAAAAAVYVLLALGSSILGVFVVYGRLARQLVPYLCLATACAARGAWSRGRLRGGRLGLAMGLLGLQFAVNAAPPFAQRFPGDFEREAGERYGAVARASTLAGCCWQFETDLIHRHGAPPPREPRYVLLNGSYLYPVRGAQPPPPGREVLAAAHPIQFVPYQYESYGPGERALLRKTDVRMRLVDTAGAAAPGPI